jgi:2-polyprenyl-3-methyl-5-hydroxy-6-metoxy-1,4-benzoquinol methylase
MGNLERLSEKYRSHHRERDEFVFGADERATLFAGLVGGPGLRVLDFGCRTGALTQHYATGNDVVGIDVDEGALDRARERLGIETLWADITDELPIEPETFDVVVAGEVLEHVADPSAAVANAYRALRPGGRFVGSVPNAFRLKSRLRYLAGRHPETDKTHLQQFTPNDLRALLSSRFDDVSLTFAVGRYKRINPQLMARVQVFRARKS